MSLRNLYLFMQLRKLYQGTFQKSRAFLYAALGIPRAKHLLFKTYISWENRITPSDCILLVHYDSVDAEMEKFIREYLLVNPFYMKGYAVENHGHVFLFDFSSRRNDWQHFLEGRYSRFSKAMKDGIRDYYKEPTPEWAYMDSFLHPDDYWETYAQLLDMPTEALQEVGELCDPWNPEQEELRIKTVHELLGN